MSININSKIECKRAIIDWQLYQNSVGLTPDEADAIYLKYGEEVETWIEQAKDSETEYDFTEEEWDNYTDQGRDKAVETGGHDGDKSSMRWRGAVDSVAAAGGAIVSTTLSCIGIKAATEAGKKAFQAATTKAVAESTAKLAEKVGVEAGKNAFKNSATKLTEKAGEQAIEAAAAQNAAATSKQIGFMIAAPIILATGLAYVSKKPNKKEYEACMKLGELLKGDQTKELNDQQTKMEKTSNDILNKGLEAEALKLSTEEQVTTMSEDLADDVEMSKSRVEGLKTRAASGDKLSDSEKADYKEHANELSLVGEKKR